jgi:DNA-binding transcriptional regulator YdaS (Cro superfamily)
MTLNDYLAQLTQQEQLLFRDTVLDRAGIRPAAWYQWRLGRTQPRPSHAQLLVALSHGQIDLHDLRPGDYGLAEDV